MKKIGILSDTHGMLRPEVVTALQGCEAILHGGDINKQTILDDLEKIAPVYVVRGNNDKEWAEHIPETLTCEVCGLRIFMVHNRKFIPDDLNDVDLVVFGHSHKYEDKTEHGIRYLNPGSCGPRRFNQEITLAVLYLSGGSQSPTEIKPSEDLDQTGKIGKIEKVEIAHPQKSSAKSSAKSPKTSPADGDPIPTNIGERIPAITKDIDAGKTVKQIARRHRISEELAEQIARMYLTHPGVDVDGILRRIGL